MEVVKTEAPISSADNSGIFSRIYITAAKYWIKKKGYVRIS
jgi:hypothetical protein